MKWLVVTVAFSPVIAHSAQINDDETELRIRLKNDFRRADKPSAGSSRDIYAWTQGGLIDMNTQYFSDFIGVSAGAYYVYKLGAKDRWSTRWYLADHDSFGYAIGAVKLKPADGIKLKIGRFGTDYGYGSLPYRIPLIADNSSRTLPTVSEGALGHFELNDNVELWAMWRSRVFYYVDAAEKGLRDEGIYNSSSGKIDRRRARSFLAGSWHDSDSRYSLGTSWQDDVSTQVQTIFEKTHRFEGKRSLKWELMGFYGQVNGLSKQNSYHDETALVSGRLTYSFANMKLFTSVGKLTHDINPYIVYTDIGYPDALSIDRNKESMLSFQVGAQYYFTPNFGVMIAPIVTKGYQDQQRTIKINGLGVVGGVMYNFTDGMLKGLNMYVAADRAREKRPGSALGDRLNYWDIKAGIQYDFMLK
ncbi:glucuronide uptake porin UidC [Brenneria corticis]|uniref:glucuronide uptake porin UidC n=1 Tax=Brenneria corticis TaxID=2173106 RepID=UPI003AA83E90